MNRSVKKGPFVNLNLLKKINYNIKNKSKKIINTWARSSVITPKFIGHTLGIHNGKKFIKVYITEDMVGHKCGEFSPTRIFRKHSSKKINK